MQSMDGRGIQLYISHLKGVFAAGEAPPLKAQDDHEEGAAPIPHTPLAACSTLQPLAIGYPPAQSAPSKLLYIGLS